MAVVFSGCTIARSSSRSVSRSDVTNDLIIQNNSDSFEAMIIRLHISPAENLKARRNLLEIGQVAEDALVSALDISGRKRRT